MTSEMEGADRKSTVHARNLDNYSHHEPVASQSSVHLAKADSRKMLTTWQWYTILAFVPIVSISLWLYAFQFVHTSLSTIHNRHIALIIAHPDDEAMFFAPTLLALSKPELGNTLQVVCLSSGNADGLGQTRKKELTKSCNMLGVPSSPHTVTCIEHKELPDSMSTSWPASTISSVLTKTLSSNPKIDTLITFDKHGISNHPNHISLLAGAIEYIRSIPHPHPILLYTLESVNIVRKYASVFDAMISLLARWRVRGEGWCGEGAPKEVLFISGWQEYRKAQQAMVYGHESQMRWFRWGWIVFSRYMLINDLRFLDLTKV